MATVPRICGHFSDGTQPFGKIRHLTGPLLPLFPIFTPRHESSRKRIEKRKREGKQKTPLISTTTKRGKATDRREKPTELRLGSRTGGINYEYFTKPFTPTQSASSLDSESRKHRVVSQETFARAQALEPHADSGPPRPFQATPFNGRDDPGLKWPGPNLRRGGPISLRAVVFPPAGFSVPGAQYVLSSSPSPKACRILKKCCAEYFLATTFSGRKAFRNLPNPPFPGSGPQKAHKNSATTPYDPLFHLVHILHHPDYSRPISG